MSDDECLATSQCSLNNLEVRTERQHLREHAPQLHPKLPEVSSPMDSRKMDECKLLTTAVATYFS